eukprot:CAMPEP_0173456540 /NCGR_PEP_ID=MMETSP1357-20121228/56214_1 /TAXON_ID=77926 /ORGANISM="Hemiselmis rufescens, Strain PCC563" /LENGTH=60 /DNA_ID=CAMNT_0014423775 /DNA_START=45 /DNA_END=224 /DNA_ORIENTATION=+
MKAGGVVARSSALSAGSSNTAAFLPPRPPACGMRYRTESLPLLMLSYTSIADLLRLPALS